MTTKLIFASYLSLNINEIAAKQSKIVLCKIIGVM